MPQHESNPALRERLPRLAQTFEHEDVMPQIRLGIIVHQPEANGKRPADLVCQINRVFQRVIPHGALRLLHPIQHVVARQCVARIEGADPRGGDARHVHKLKRMGPAAWATANPPGAGRAQRPTRALGCDSSMICWDVLIEKLRCGFTEPYPCSIPSVSTNRQRSRASADSARTAPRVGR
jgi:hypothetical protein